MVRLLKEAETQAQKTGGQFAPPESGNGSFESFVDLHCERLVQCLTMIVLDPDLARDAAQEAFIRLYLHWDDVGNLRDPVAWLFKVGINRSKDIRRRAVRSARLLQRLSLAATEKHDPLPWHPETSFLELLRDLPARQRAAATLYYLADFSVSEIAQVMHVSEGSVNRHLFRARERVRKMLEVT